MPALSALSRPQSLWREAADAMRRAILTAELPAGERVSEARLAERLGVSRQPVRDAVRLLIQEGLLAQRDGVTTVVGCTEEDVRQLYRFREHLETYAVRAAALGGVSGEAAHELRRFVEAMKAASLVGDTVAHVEADLAFHRALVVASGDRWVRTAWEGLAPTLRVTMTVGRKSPQQAPGGGPRAASQRRHWRVMEHVLAGQADLAETALRESLSVTLARLVTRLHPAAPDSLVPREPAPPPARPAAGSARE